MFKPNRHKSNILSIMNSSLINLPTPSSITSWWNFGSLLGLCLMMQLVTGILVAMHYCPNPQLTFTSLTHLSSDVSSGWLIRFMHANGASLFFICMYTHIGRSMYYSSFKMKATWMMGTLILLSTMATAFLGYVLPWGQMSFWGATVITNLVSTIPLLGEQLVNWLWGGFSMGEPTLTRFFTIHFTLPFVIMIMVIIHIFFLHSTGSSNPLGLNSNMDKLPFHPFFSSSDIMGFIIMLFVFVMLNLMYPLILNDPDNYVPANSLTTPVHIQPEWYFLFAYAILRSIPNKLGGVIALVSAIMVLMILPFTENSNLKSENYYPINQVFFLTFITNIILLTWIGAHPVEAPFILMGQMSTVIHFLYPTLNPIVSQLWNRTIM